jgi:diguanylate cyclase (GGDEF)-like protein
MNDTGIAPALDPVIKVSPIFKDLSELELNAVTVFLEPRRVKKGEIIFNEGAQGEELFILVSGKVSAYVTQADGNRRWMFEIKPGDFFGEMSVIANESRSATLTAKVDTELLVIHGIDFYRLIYEHPMIGVKMLKSINAVQNIWLEQTSRYLVDLMRWGETARLRAVSDPLTGLYNRTFLDESANDRFKQGSVGTRNVSLILIDLDNIHEVNDKFGPRAGDQVFIETAKVLRSNTRPGDICARLAGDEFAVFLPDTKLEDALGIAKRIREAVALQKMTVPVKPEGKAKITVTTSAGVATAPIHADSWNKLLLTADSALRGSKEMGRNRVTIAK